MTLRPKSRPIAADPLVITRAKLNDRLDAVRREGKSIGLVPTMGALHAGHLSLVDAAKRECGFAVVTIFVNPTQFGPGEDFALYPRMLDADLAALTAGGADLVFSPSVEEMYPPGQTTVVEVGGVAEPWEGTCRPGHFRGVATIVLKLFHLTMPKIAYFGRKDFQQAAVVRRMVEDLNLPVEIRVCPIVREPDGLAMSSRNAYLSPDERRRALALSASLLLARQLAAKGERDASVIVERMRARLAADEVRIDYAALVDPETLSEVRELHGPAVALVAGWVGKTRLIDNEILE